MHDYLSKRLSPGTFILLIIICFIILFSVLLIPKNIKDYLVLISAIALVIGVLFTQAIKLYSEVRDRAFSLLRQNRESPEYNVAAGRVARHFFKKGKFSREDVINLYKSDEEYDVEIRRAIVIVANFYEEMAIAIKYNEVNEALLKDFYIGTFVRLYDNIKEFLIVVRNDPPIDNSPFKELRRPDVLCNLDLLYIRWKPKYEILMEHLRQGSNNVAPASREVPSSSAPPSESGKQ